MQRRACDPRDDWRRRVESHGLFYHTLGGETYCTMRGQADLLAQLAKHRIARIFVRRPAAARQAPARCVAQPDENDLAAGREREGVRAERTRSADEPAGLEQLMAGGQDRPEKGVGQAHWQRI